MKNLGNLAVILFACMAVTCSLTSTVDDAASTFESSFTLQDFTYNGTHTLYVLLAPFQEIDAYNFDTPDQEIWQFGTSTDSTGTFDIAIDPIEYESSDGDTEIFDAYLFIASDEDDSGDFSLNDLVMPAYRVQIEDGEPYVLSDLTFDVGGLETGPRYYDLRISIVSTLLEEAVTPENPVYLRIDNGDNADFTLAPNFRQFTITDGRLLDGDVYVFSIPAVPDTYRVLIAHDINGDGPGPGDYASESDRTAVTTSFSNPGTTPYDSLFLTLDASVTLTN